MAKPLLADVLWHAANVMLPDGVAYSHDYYVSDYSCDACHSAARDLGIRGAGDYCADLFGAMGMPNPYDNFRAFDEFREGEERQSARYFWLLLAVCVAEDEGIEIEVSA